MFHHRQELFSRPRWSSSARYPTATQCGRSPHGLRRRGRSWRAGRSDCQNWLPPEISRNCQKGLAADRCLHRNLCADHRSIRDRADEPEVQPRVAVPLSDRGVVRALIYKAVGYRTNQEARHCRNRPDSAAAVDLLVDETTGSDLGECAVPVIVVEKVGRLGRRAEKMSPLIGRGSTQTDRPAVRCRNRPKLPLGRAAVERHDAVGYLRESASRLL